jgi:large subunit ribosomal protein L25
MAALNATFEFKGETRKTLGKGSARAARRAGSVPVVMYAKGKNPTQASVEANALSLAYLKGGFMNKIVALKLDDGKTYYGVAREVQMHPVSDKIEHVDFQQVEAASEIKVSVPVHVSGVEKSAGLKRGGVLNIVSHQVPLICTASKIPASIDVDVSELNIGSSIHLSDVKLPEGVRAASKRVDVTIVSISGRAEEKEDAPTAPTAAAVPASKVAEQPAAGAAAKPAAKK